MNVSILSAWVGKTFSVHPAAGDDLYVKMLEIGVLILLDGVDNSFSVRSAANGDLLC